MSAVERNIFNDAKVVKMNVSTRTPERKSPCLSYYYGVFSSHTDIHKTHTIPLADPDLQAYFGTCVCSTYTTPMTLVA